MAVIGLAWLIIPTLPPRVMIIVTVLALFGAVMTTLTRTNSVLRHAVKFSGW
jgi:hypothetical protein